MRIVNVQGRAQVQYKAEVFINAQWASGGDSSRTRTARGLPTGPDMLHIYMEHRTLAERRAGQESSVRDGRLVGLLPGNGRRPTESQTGEAEFWRQKQANRGSRTARAETGRF